MGYNSNVFFAIAAEPNQLTAFFAAARLEYPQAVSVVLKEFTPRYGQWDGLRVFVIECNGKWYDSYVDVAAVNRLWGFAAEHEEQFGLYGRYLRIGEGDNDTEQQTIGDAYDLANIVTEIQSEVNYEQDENPGTGGQSLEGTGSSAPGAGRQQGPGGSVLADASLGSDPQGV